MLIHIDPTADIIQTIEFLSNVMTKGVHLKVSEEQYYQIDKIAGGWRLKKVPVEIKKGIIFMVIRPDTIQSRKYILP